MDRSRPARDGVRLYCRETVEIALRALDEGVTTREAGTLVGPPSTTVSRLAAGRVQSRILRTFRQPLRLAFRYSYPSGSVTFR